LFLYLPLLLFLLLVSLDLHVPLSFPTRRSSDLFLIKLSGILAATTSPVTTFSSPAKTSVLTRNFLGCISSTVPIAFKCTPAGVGFIYLPCKLAVTSLGACLPSPGSCPYFRWRAIAAETVP